jgi:hypothetical protein
VSVGLTRVSLADLRALAHALDKGRLACPLGRAALLAAGLGHLTDDLAVLDGLDRAAAGAVLEATIAERELRPGPRLELVWTGPEAPVSTARDTAVVVRQLFAEARRAVLVAGFSFDHGEDILRPLHAAMRDRGVEATLFLDLPCAAPGADPGAVAAAAIDAFLARNWPFGDPRPLIYYDPRTVAPGARASLHAKCVVVDGQRTLITSANFTDRGQTRNLEAGVLIDDEGFAIGLARQWRSLIEAGLVARR